MIRWLQSYPYFFKEALLGMRENGGVAALTIATTAVSLVFLGALWVVQLNVSALVDSWREKFQIEVFFKDTSSAGQRGAVKKMILKGEAVERAEERTSAQAMKSFRRDLGANADILDGLGDAFLPASLRITLRPASRNMANIESLVAQVRVMPGVERLRNDLAWLRKLEGAIRFLNLAAWTLSILLGLGVLFIIANTIRLTLFARKEDIAIMHLVGATDGFIKTPYVTEGVLCGVLGGAAAFLVLWLVHNVVLLPMISGYLSGDFTIQAGGWPLVFLLVGSGAVLGFLGSAVTVGHYLRKQRE
ncbi:MAG: ABC transporter permease [bacterium]